jgi:hypothetical protein
MPDDLDYELRLVAIGGRGRDSCRTGHFGPPAAGAEVVAVDAAPANVELVGAAARRSGFERLRVLDASSLEDLDVGHADAVRVRHATPGAVRVALEAPAVTLAAGHRGEADRLVVVRRLARVAGGGAYMNTLRGSGVPQRSFDGPFESSHLVWDLLFGRRESANLGNHWELAQLTVAELPATAERLPLAHRLDGQALGRL